MGAAKTQKRGQEPRWPALLAIVTVGLVNTALPGYLAIGPRWLLIAVVLALEVPAMVLHRRGYHWVNQALGYAASGVITGFLGWSLALLIWRLPTHKDTPLEMLRAAAVMWPSNVLVFAMWYWRLDGGGPAGRDKLPGHTEGAFLFPQMNLDWTRGKWSPRFLDYLFLAFNTSTALSPTDTAILGRWAKVLVMTQASISLLIIILLAARAVNTL